MSAYVCHEFHIATCAQIIKDSGIAEVEDIARPDIAVLLARQNMLSVAWRYGPEGHAAYGQMIRTVLGELVGSDWEVDGDAIAVAQATVGDVLAGQLTGTPAEFLAACRWASPRRYEAEEAHAYLRCLRYQSCENPDWSTCMVARWIEQAISEQARRMEEKLLRGRHVWQVNYPNVALPAA